MSTKHTPQSFVREALDAEREQWTGEPASAPLQRTPAPQKAAHGCCADKACTDATCMELPAGKTCGHCVHERRCCLMFGHKPGDTYCDWFPRRFRERDAGAAEIGGTA